ncbi:MAG: hypothetical protein EBZ49_01775 [Proteobacteria bacterium]|nr:hypothetical protein [Pseudomonadota bacterium]
MPNYKFLNTATGDVVEHSMRIAKYDEFLEMNPTLQRYYTIDDVPATISGTGGIKTDNGFREVLSKVAEAHPNSTLADRTLQKSSTQVKVDNAVNKYRT